MGDLDVIEATRRCAAQLDQAGHAAWAAKLRLAVDAASTGGELVMAVRHHLRSLRDAEPALPAELTRAIDDILSVIAETGW